MTGGTLVERVDRWATRFGFRPLAAKGYRAYRSVRDSVRDVKYRLNTVDGETYRVTVGTAEAVFHIPTRQEFLDLDRLEERPILEDMVEQLRPDDVVYDVGANIGVYACLAADVVEPDVVAFEPHPSNARRMEENASLNGADVSIHQCALAGADGKTKLTLAPGFAADRLGSAGHTLLSEYHEDEDTKSVEVSMRHGDSYVSAEGLEPPTVVKIDVEGAEMDVVRGLESTLSRPDCRLVYCEIHSERLRSQGHSTAALRERLEEYGFDVDSLTVRDGQPFLRARKDED